MVNATGKDAFFLQGGVEKPMYRGELISGTMLPRNGIVLEELSVEFEDPLFRYTQIDRQGDIAIYSQEHKVSTVCRFEVIRIRIADAHTWPNGQVTPEREIYPSPHAWGTHGWTFFSLSAAQECQQRLLQSAQRCKHAI